jgi:hypothetical protein
MKRRDVLATVAVLISTGCLDGSDTGNEGDGDGNISGPETAIPP